MAPMASRKASRAANRKRKRGEIAPDAPVKRDSVEPLSSRPDFFFQLPAELRDQIYNEIWMQKTPFLIDFGQSNFQFKVSYDDAAEPTEYWARPHGVVHFDDDHTPDFTPRPPWVLTNRQMLCESIAQFQRKLKWTYRGVLRYETGVYPAVRVREPMPCFSAPLVIRKSLLRPWDAYGLELSKVKLHMQTEVVGGKQGVKNLWTIEDPLLKWLTDVRTPFNTRALRIEIDSSAWSINTNAATTIVLNRLLALHVPNLRNLVISYSCSDRRNKMEFIESRLRQPLIDAGMALMDGDCSFSCESVGPRLQHPRGLAVSMVTSVFTWDLIFTRG